MCSSLLPDVKEILSLGCSCNSWPLTFEHWYHKWICIGWYSAKKSSWKRLCDKIDLFFQWKSSPWASDDKTTHSCHPTFQSLARSLFLMLWRWKCIYFYMWDLFIPLHFHLLFIYQSRKGACQFKTNKILYMWVAPDSLQIPTEAFIVKYPCLDVVKAETFMDSFCPPFGWQCCSL